MGAPLKNQSAKKFPKLKERGILKEIYDSYCQHIAQGYSKNSWYWEGKGHFLTSETLEKYFLEFPEDFPSMKRTIAHAKSYFFWESAVRSSALGENEKANTASLQMIMRNKFNWDKPQQQNEQLDDKLDGHLLIIKPHREN